MNKTLCGLLAAASIVGAAACQQVKIIKTGDVTGDGIPDIMLSNADGIREIHIGQKDGSYNVARETTQDRGVSYFETNKNEVYFWNGQNYALSPKPKK